MSILLFLITFTSNPVVIRINTISNSTKVYCFFFVITSQVSVLSLSNLGYVPLFFLLKDI